MMSCYQLMYSVVMIGDGMTDYEASPPAVSYLAQINTIIV